MGSILYLHQSPPVGGDTAFANMYLAYETLSEPIKRLVEGLSAFHTSAHVYSRGEYERSRQEVSRGRPSHRAHASGDWTQVPVRQSRLHQAHRRPEEARERCAPEMLVRHAETPEFQCRFRWERHSVAFWDNRCAMHRATFDYHPHVRHGHRVTIKGDRPF